MYQVNYSNSNAKIVDSIPRKHTEKENEYCLKRLGQSTCQMHDYKCKTLWNFIY